MQLEADKIYQGTSQINLGTGPGRPWCRYATAPRCTCDTMIIDTKVLSEHPCFYSVTTTCEDQSSPLIDTYEVARVELSVTVILKQYSYYYCMLLYAHAYCFDYFRQSALIRRVLTFVVPCRRAVTRYNAVPETTQSRL